VANPFRLQKGLFLASLDFFAGRLRSGGQFVPETRIDSNLMTGFVQWRNGSRIPKAGRSTREQMGRMQPQGFAPVLPG
jgi:hypothetical protein